MPLFADTTDWDEAYVMAARDMLMSSLLFALGDRKAGQVWATLGFIAWKKVLHEPVG